MEEQSEVIENGSSIPPLIGDVDLDNLQQSFPFILQISLGDILLSLHMLMFFFEEKSEINFFC
jgi:hypothetical protein